MDRSKGFSDDVVIFEASVTVLGQEDGPVSVRCRLVVDLPITRYRHRRFVVVGGNQIARLPPFSWGMQVSENGAKEPTMRYNWEIQLTGSERCI